MINIFYYSNTSHRYYQRNQNNGAGAEKKKIIQDIGYATKWQTTEHNNKNETYTLF
jgi:hypothetical protein